jgi:hypothetical protein
MRSLHSAKVYIEILFQLVVRGLIHADLKILICIVISTRILPWINNIALQLEISAYFLA